MQSSFITSEKLTPIVVPKTSDVLASELRRRILSGALPPGASLPAERELVAQTGLSRGSVRDALRILESESLVITRPGRYGGSVANKPDDDSLKRSISIFVHGRGITLLSLLQTREAVEPALAALAAKNRTDAELHHMVNTTDQVEAAFTDTPKFLQKNVDWHMAIAAASHNELLRGFMHSISNMVYKASAMDNFASEGVRKQVMHAHRRILEAIVAQDEALAERRMAMHLAAVTAACRAFPTAPLVLDL
ncbi:MAG: bacterial regulatory s, gntR family protein [Polaromonas sp.]|nr:bacterial regulatory s, gntR family protein [Polaromonas sp.]